MPGPLWYRHSSRQYQRGCAVTGTERRGYGATGAVGGVRVVLAQGRCRRCYVHRGLDTAEERGADATWR
eukprot:1872680-Rhodomonas_salina.2